jgi:protein involved in polysaccharide export with SLBB domain
MRNAGVATLRIACRTVILCPALVIFAAFEAAAQDIPARPPSESRQENPALPESSGRQAVGSGTAALTTSMEVLNDSVKLGPGDRVSFRVVEERRDPIGLFVTDTGEMEVPYIGRVKAADKTCKQVAFEIKPLLEKEYFNRATVIIGLDIISTRSRGKIYITGQVRSQGVMEILPDDPGFTVSRAILRAGGLADFADKRKVRLVRKKEGATGGSSASRTAQKDSTAWWKVWKSRKSSASDPTTETIYIDLVEILEKGHLEKDPVLKPGDLIVVPSRTFNF